MADQVNNPFVNLAARKEDEDEEESGCFASRGKASDTNGRRRKYFTSPEEIHGH